MAILSSLVKTMLTKTVMSHGCRPLMTMQIVSVQSMVNDVITSLFAKFGDL